MPSRCWMCGMGITQGNSEPTVDPNIRLCWKCDESINRKPPSAFNGLGRLVALANAGFAINAIDTTEVKE